MRRACLHISTLLSLLFCLNWIAQGDTIYVPQDQPTLSAALSAAGNGDTILLADGIYSEDQLSVFDKSVTIGSANGAPAACILDATLLTFHTDDAQSHTLTIRDITFRNDPDTSLHFVNDFDDQPASDDHVTVSNCIFTGGLSGQILMEDSYSTLTVSGCTFDSDISAITGFFKNLTFTDNTMRNGSIWCNPLNSLTIARCSFTNVPMAFQISSIGGVTVTDSTFSDATTGAIRAFAISNPALPCIFRRCTFRNIATPEGTLLLEGGTTLIDSCVFQGNTTPGYIGGAILNYRGDLRVTNSTFVHNTANQGGAIGSVSDGITTLINCTFVDNQATVEGGALYHQSTSSAPGSGIQIANCIFWGDTAPSAPEFQNVSPVPPQILHSLLQDYPGMTATPDADGNFTANPLFFRSPSPGADGQWGTDDDDFGDLHLHYGSPAIDVGDAGLLPPDLTDLDSDGDTAELLPLDLDGNPRISGNTLDLGAYEFLFPADVTGLVVVTPGPFTFSRATRAYMQVLTITNTGKIPIAGPISVVLDNLANASLANASGKTDALLPGGIPYRNVIGDLAPGTSVTVSLSFTKTGGGSITYTPHVIVGPGSR